MTTRRTFIQSLAATAAMGPTILTSRSRAQDKTAANDRIQLAFIGVGTMGRGHLGKFLGQKDVQVVAVCDVVQERIDDAKKMVENRYASDLKGEYKGCAAYNDLRKLLEDKAIDAVLIATPDHWHATACILAAQAKKDIYCEKPLTHTIAQGRRIIDAVRKNALVFQTGSQQRSEFGNRFRTAVELVRNGRIGKLKTVRVGVGGPPIAYNLEPQEIPEGTEWDMWCGPSVKLGYNEQLCPKGVHRHFPAWRNYKEYGGGGLADMGAHHFDIAQWAMGMDDSGPVTIEPPSGKETTGLKYVYASGVEMFHGGPSGCTFEGTDGTIYVDRGALESKPGEILTTPLKEGDFRVYPSSDHARNWLDCVRTRKDPICTAEIGHHSATICHLGNIGYALRRTLKWDPKKEQFTGDDEANKLLDYEPRAPWKV
jgi:predicted dehydrogenase